MKHRINKNDESQLGLLMQDTLESFFEYEDSINPSESHKKNVKAKLEKLILILKVTNNKYLSEIEYLRHELD
ncbi:MAG: hypothetical protein R8G33_09660 [Gammaproteobacteria bacterium]|nr:hypothetical protein [Gammaproteobacteria bacterium]